jgi:ectonucleotide pyrophosphatase/phosphodiesterase family member 5
MIEVIFLDSTGHEFGPYSIEMKNKLEYLDGILGYLIEKMKSNKLYDKLNLIITSDHGMEQVNSTSKIVLNQYLDTDLFDMYGSHAVLSLFLKNSKQQFNYSILVLILNK